MSFRLTKCFNSHLLDDGTLDKEYDLNDKIELNEYSSMDIPRAVYNKLGYIEDILGKYNVESVEELEQKLKNAIVPKFRVGQEVYKINGHYDDDFNYEYTIEKFIIENIHYHTKCDIDNKSYDLSGGWKCVGERDLFATKEEAEEKLKQLREVIHE